MLWSVLLLAAAQGPVTAARPPLALFDTFRQICIEGSGRLLAGTRPARLAELPGGARKALQLLHPRYFRDSEARFRSALGGGRTIAGSAVPNTAYRIEGHARAWLLTPMPGAGADTIGEQCVMIWAGRDYEAAALALHEALGMRGGHFPPAVMPENLGWADMSFEGNWATAASLGDWTLLSTLPAVEPASAPAPANGY